MKIVFLSNFYNHHQAFISRELYKLTQGEYVFVVTSNIPEDRRALGYLDINDPFILYYQNSSEPEKIQKLIDDADVVIIGSAPETFLNTRKKNKKIILRYSERPLKNGFQWWKYPLRFFKWHRKNPCGVPIYLLCASAYTASDYRKFGLFKNRAYKWGYFPERKKYESVKALIDQKQKNKILWCGRFLDWKHPDDVLKVAVRLKNDGYDFYMNIIGTGEMEAELKSMAVQQGLSDVVCFLGSMTPDKVREHMERAGIYLFTSDRKEGWGVVLNEAMNSGCAVVASHEIGSVPYLLENQKNGLIYQSGNVEMLYKKTKYLLDNPEKQEQLGAAAYQSISEVWNPENAAKQLMILLEHIIKGEPCDLIKAGPCSAAEVAKEYLLR